VRVRARLGFGFVFGWGLERVRVRVRVRGYRCSFNNANAMRPNGIKNQGEAIIKTIRVEINIKTFIEMWENWGDSCMSRLSISILKRTMMRPFRVRVRVRWRGEGVRMIEVG